MIVVLKPDAKEAKVDALKKKISELGVKINYSKGTDTTILGLIGETQAIDIHKLRSNEIVEKVIRVQEPYKKANRAFHPQDTIVNVDGVPIGEGHFTMIAGPCSVESEEQIVGIAKAVDRKSVV